MGCKEAGFDIIVGIIGEINVDLRPQLVLRFWNAFAFQQQSTSMKPPKNFLFLKYSKPCVIVQRLVANWQRVGMDNMFASDEIKKLMIQDGCVGSRYDRDCLIRNVPIFS
jgi:hypothetical protein